MTQWLNLFGWVGCVVYSTIPSFCLLIHPRAAYWRSRKHSPFLILLPTWIATWIILGWLTSPWRHTILYTAPWTWIPAILLFSTGLWIYSQSAEHFSATQLGGLPEIRPNHREQQLATSGIRSRVRHPVYLAHLCEMLAWSIGTGLAVCYVLTGFAVVTGAIMIRLEDAELEQRFGEEYRTYREAVPAVLPRIKQAPGRTP
jgi:protein-S-isoprenylcysteine O-methyltransferase Ste14